MTRILPALVVCALLPAACGSSGSGSIPRAAAERLAAESDRVAARAQAGDGCGAAAAAGGLVRDSTAFPRVHAAALALAREITCVPPAPAAREPAPTTVPEENRDEQGQRHKHRDKHGKDGD